MNIICWGTSHFGVFLRLTETQLNVRLTTKSKLISPLNDQVDI